MPGFEWIGEEEEREVRDVLRSGVFMRYGFDPARQGHYKTRDLEEALESRFGVAHAHVCSSGTAALAAALAAAGVGAGDEVILPPFTFVADVEVVLLAGAVPVFASIDETLCLDPEAVEAAITPRTKAIIVVHMCGSMARIDALVALGKRHSVTLIEDAAQAVGATFRGKPLGSFGKAGCVSFDYVKTVTCGEGGAVLTDDEGFYRIVDAFTDHGHDHLGADRGADDHPHLGMNFRTSELHSAVGLAQIRKLDRMLDVQRETKGFLKEGLSGIPGVGFRHVPDEAGDSATFLSLRLPAEAAAREALGRLSSAGVDGCFYWYDNKWHYHRQWGHFQRLQSPAVLAVDKFGYARDWESMDFRQSDAIMSRTISMLIKLSWTEDEKKDRLERMRDALRGLSS